GCFSQIARHVFSSAGRAGYPANRTGRKNVRKICYRPVILKHLDRQENNQGARGWMICLRNWQTA
ncbi:MAG: hypothetical protein IJS15_08210, partial [Victivallales bacterium]|nr:hypothetical protein [Victivallales bacterium]